MLRTQAQGAAFLLPILVACAACEPRLPDDLRSLMEAMNSSHETISVNAANKVSESYGRGGLLTVLREGERRARARAARWLWKFPDDEVERALITVVEDETDSFLRSQALRTLGEIGTVNALPTLEAAARSSDELVSFSAKNAVRQIRGRLALKP